ncbi:M28 family peptidase [Clostridium sp. MCC353]|uniref:M28 family peptidase n=1 Tax=Clostridium sp. MCC353 TaxID=2592646 RepID=UPI001C0269C6|nr:M28 family peptidase [Clostridium sp. MCC353]MBT9779363.1 M28 family peptidase [Clostridium sp. MCC353]
MDSRDAYVSAIDVSYSYRLAKRMETYKTNPVLGYRTAGSEAEFLTGEMLVREMKEIGLEDVRKDEIVLDSWEFKKAVLRCRDGDGKLMEFQLGAYQTDFHTNGFQQFPLVYIGKGTSADYENVDVHGKLVLADINQRDEWWINFPVYQAHKKGAAALIAVQEGGYGKIHKSALNAQDIAGPKDAPAFSISQEDADRLKSLLKGKQEITVWFDAESTVKEKQVSYNICGSIPGKCEGRMIVLSAHYDSYFSGFQDDNAAVAMMFGIAKAMKDSGYRPEQTIVFCAMAAEEWGIVNSKYDWSTGAYEQVFHARPEWRGRVTANLNFELPAHAHNKKDAVRCTYEYRTFTEAFLKTIQVDGEAYPEGIEVLCPIETWSDDFSMAIAGIPSVVNDFSSGEFMETHYHSQFDNENFYQENVYRFHHYLYGLMALELDQTALPPLDFSELFYAAEKRVDWELCERTGAEGERLRNLLKWAQRESKGLYETIDKINGDYRQADGEAEKGRIRGECGMLYDWLMKMFQKEQDSFVRLNWHDDVLFPQEAVQNNLKYLNRALSCLRDRDVKGALEAVYGIDNNRYAFLFEEDVYRYFTEYVLEQPADRLKWGFGRIVHHENMFGLVQGLKARLKDKEPDVERETDYLEETAEKQRAYYVDDIRYMIHETEIMIQMIEKAKDMLDYGKSESIPSGKEGF